MRISIVIPAFNAEAVIAPCIESILGQSHEDIEVVCVDDGSTDDTLALLESISLDDNRVRPIHQDNRGVSAARNAGLAACTGDVVLFVDADDELVPGALASIDSRFSYGGVDCMVFGMRVEPEEATPITLAHRLAPRDAILVDRPFDLIFREKTHPYAFRVAFLRSFLLENDLRFDEGLTLGEDEAFLMTSYRLVHRAILSSEQLYLYRMSEASASHKDNASIEVLPAKLEKHLALVKSVMGEWKSRGLDSSCDQALLDWCLDLLMLDVSRLEPERQVAFYTSLWDALVGYYGGDGGRSIASAVSDACLRSIQRAAFGATQGPVIPRHLLVAFYVSRRGLAAVAERAVAGLRGRGAY